MRKPTPRTAFFTLVIVASCFCFFTIYSRSFISHFYADILSLGENQLEPDSKYVHQPSSCSLAGKSPEMIMLVSSRPTSFALRKSIRNTWGSTAMTCGIRIIFGFAWPNNQTLQETIAVESQSYDDIIQLRNFNDSYQSQTDVVLSYYEWSQKFCDAKFVAKSDDDIWINLPEIMNFLKNIRKRHFLAGYMFSPGNEVIRDVDHPQKLTPDERAGNKFPAYSSGIFYAFPKHLIGPVLNVSRGMKQYWIDDAFVTGDVVEKINLGVMHPTIWRKNIPGIYDNNQDSENVYRTVEMEFEYSEKFFLHGNASRSCELVKFTIAHRITGPLNDHFYKLSCLDGVRKCLS